MDREKFENTLEIIVENISGSKLISHIITAVLIFFVLLSLTPIISWWGGLAGSLTLICLIVISRFNIISETSIPKKRLRKWIRLSSYSILFGVVFYTGCMIHSSTLVNKLINESRNEQKLSLNNNVNTTPEKNAETVEINESNQE